MEGEGSGVYSDGVVIGELLFSMAVGNGGGLCSSASENVVVG
jgi:hypothetical protein